MSAAGWELLLQPAGDAALATIAARASAPRAINDSMQRQQTGGTTPASITPVGPVCTIGLPPLR